MSISKFEQGREAISLGLSRFAEWLPILLRAALLLLSIWYGCELFYNSTGLGPRVFLVMLALLFVLICFRAMQSTYQQADKLDSAAPIPLWPFILINLLMILVVSAIGKWERDRGATGVTSGLLGFTQHWVQIIGTLFTGGR